MTTPRRSFRSSLLATRRISFFRREDLLRIAAAVCALPILLSCNSPSANVPTPSGSQQVTIAFSGTFDMTNLAQPQRGPHSYTYGVRWKYTWNGSWDQLCGGGRINSGQMPFQIVDISQQTYSVQAVRV
jgi:hypothetical protein